MAFPVGWPPRVATSIRSIRVYLTGTSTALFSDNAFIFSAIANANTFSPLPVVPEGGERTQANVPVPPWGGGQNSVSSGDVSPGDPRFGGAATPQPTPMIWTKTLQIRNTSTGALEFSFDGTNVHGSVPANTVYTYYDRYEAGICVRGNGGTPTFIIEGW